MFSPIMRSQEGDIVSATKSIIKTHVAVKRYSKYSDGIIEKTTITVNCTMETMSKLTVTSMNCLKMGFKITI